MSEEKFLTRPSPRASAFERSEPKRNGSWAAHKSTGFLCGKKSKHNVALHVVDVSGTIPWRLDTTSGKYGRLLREDRFPVFSRSMVFDLLNHCNSKLSGRRKAHDVFSQMAAVRNLELSGCEHAGVLPSGIRLFVYYPTRFRGISRVGLSGECIEMRIYWGEASEEEEGGREELRDRLSGGASDREARSWVKAMVLRMGSLVDPMVIEPQQDFAQWRSSGLSAAGSGRALAGFILSLAAGARGGG